MRFELGRAFEALGDRIRARSAFEAVAAVDPTFCDVEEWLERDRRRDAKPEPSDAAAGAGFESFEDLIGEDAEAAADAGGRAGELRRRDRRGQREEAEPEPLEAPLDDEPAAPEPPPRAAATRSRAPAAKPARKKKISFV